MHPWPASYRDVSRLEIKKLALKSVMCDVIKIRLKRRDATRRIIQEKLYIKFSNPSFKIGSSTAVLIFTGWFPFPLLSAILLFRHIFMTSPMTLSSASFFTLNVFKLKYKMLKK